MSSTKHSSIAPCANTQTQAEPMALSLVLDTVPDASCVSTTCEECMDCPALWTLRLCGHCAEWLPIRDAYLRDVELGTEMDGPLGPEWGDEAGT